MHHPAFAASARVRLAAAALLLVGATACRSRGPAFMPPTRPAEFSLVGVPWGIPADSVKALIEPRGYNFNQVDGDGDLWFDGRLFNAPTRIYAFMADRQLVRLRVLIATEDEDAISTYRNVRAELIKQYGPPKETVETYQAPFKKGDGREMQAVRSGKADLRSHWILSGRTSHVSVQVTEKLVVYVDYDGHSWERESLRRRKAR